MNVGIDLHATDRVGLESINQGEHLQSTACTLQPHLQICYYLRTRLSSIK
jgi:hypothetical protein